MKIHHFLLTLALAMTFGLQSCLKDSCERTVSYIRVEPVYKTAAEIHAGTVVSEPARELRNPGQLYYYDNHIFVNERGEGIHIIDNTNPQSPMPVKFLAIPGNEDLAIRNGVLYANTYIDLLAIDVQTGQLLGRTDNVFPPVWEDVANGLLLVDYLEIPTSEVMDCETFSSLEKRGEVWFDFSNGGPFIMEDMLSSTAGNSSAGGTGIGGSMARFTIMGQYLYAIDGFGMDLFDLSNANMPTDIGRIEIGWGIETIFPYEDKLFIGSNAGMFIYDNSQPTQPVQLAQFEHARACDPVFVKDNYAYVTLRSGNACEGFTNQLDLIDITNITNPVLEKTFPMDNPHGLSIKGEKLFLCEGDFGLKSFDITEPFVLDQHQLDHVKGIHAFDAISLPGNIDLLMVIGEDGFYQYSYDAAGKLSLLSKIAVQL